MPFAAKDVLRSLLLTFLILILMGGLFSLDFMSQFKIESQLLMQLGVFAWLYFAWFSPFLFFRKTLSWESIGFRKAPWLWTLLAPPLFYIAFIAVWIALYNFLIYYGWYPVGHEATPIEFGSGPLAEFFLTLFVVFIAPFLEEIFFRGFIYQGLRQSWPWWLSAVFSSLLFAFFHGDIIRALPLFLIGFALCLLFERHRSLWPCIAFHMLHNCVILFLS